MIRENIKILREKVNNACVKAGRNPEEIEIIGVTKTVDIERIKIAVDEGITHIGENRVQEYLEKYDFIKENNLKADIIGHLQTNKVKYIAGNINMIQSVDSLKLAREISKEAKKHNRTVDLLLEINAAGEESKSGVSFSEIFELVHSVSELPFVSVKGLMSIPPVFIDEVTSRGYFEKLYKIYIDIGNKNIDNICMDIMSMGMSGDYEYAILEGSNMIRIGTGIFGKR